MGSAEEASPSLKRLRGAAGLTQAELGERVGVSQQRVAQWERGHHVDPSYFVHLRGALGIGAKVLEAALTSDAGPNTNSPSSSPRPDLRIVSPASEQSAPDPRQIDFTPVQQVVFDKILECTTADSPEYLLEFLRSVGRSVGLPL
jgi:transcriptional regulator with XRE-family HTH domain